MTVLDDVDLPAPGVNTSAEAGDIAIPNNPFALRGFECVDGSLGDLGDFSTSMDAPGDASTIFERHGMRSGAVVYPACWCGCQEPLARMDIRGSGPYRLRELEGSGY